MAGFGPTAGGFGLDLLMSAGVRLLWYFGLLVSFGLKKYSRTEYASPQDSLEILHRYLHRYLKLQILNSVARNQGVIHELTESAL